MKLTQMSFKCKICGAPCENTVCEECRKKYNADVEPVQTQSAKADYGKPKLSLVPIKEFWTAVAAIREYGNEKYHDPENWKTVSVDRYFDAMLRHISACVDGGMDAKDEESGFPHLWHAACNMAFILWMQKHKKRINSDGMQKISMFCQ